MGPESEKMRKKLDAVSDWMLELHPAAFVVLAIVTIVSIATLAVYWDARRWETFQQEHGGCDATSEVRERQSVTCTTVGDLTTCTPHTYKQVRYICADGTETWR